MKDEGFRVQLSNAIMNLQVRELAPTELDAAAGVLGRGMRDNPLHIRVFGTVEPRREAALEQLFNGLLRGHHRRGLILGAFLAECLVGVCAMARPRRSQPDWHLGPVAVERDLQGQGIGTALLDEFCSRMDALASTACLETDKLENIGFYERFGFQTIIDVDVLGVPNWFMVRAPLTRRTTRRSSEPPATQSEGPARPAPSDEAPVRA